MSSVFGNVFLVGLVFSIGAIVLVIIALVLWISSRAKFIYLDNVVEGRAEITQPWHRFRRLGDSLFLWRAAFVGCVIVVLIAGALIPALPVALFSGGSFEDLSIFAMTSWGIVFGLVVLVVVIGSLYVSLFLDAFVVPIMYRFELKATEAWRHLMPWIRTYPWQFVLYGLFVLLLATGFGIVSLLVCLMTCCIAGLPYIGTVVLLPLWVTYRYLSLEWLAQFDPGFDVFAPLPVDGGELADETAVERPEVTD